MPHTIVLDDIATDLANWKGSAMQNQSSSLYCVKGYVVTFNDGKGAYPQTYNVTDPKYVRGLYVKNTGNLSAENFKSQLPVKTVLYGLLTGKMIRQKTTMPNHGCYLEFESYKENPNEIIAAYKDQGGTVTHENDVSLSILPAPIKVSINTLLNSYVAGDWNWGMDGVHVLLDGVRSPDMKQLDKNLHVKSAANGGFKLQDMDGKSASLAMWNGSDPNMLATDRGDMAVTCYPIWTGGTCGWDSNTPSDVQSNQATAPTTNHLEVTSDDGLWGRISMQRYGYKTYCLDQAFTLPQSSVPAGQSVSETQNSEELEGAYVIGGVTNYGKDGVEPYLRTYSSSGSNQIVPRNEAVLLKASDSYEWDKHNNQLVCYVKLDEADQVSQKALPTVPTADYTETKINMMSWGEPGKTTTTGDSKYDAKCRFYHLAAVDYGKSWDMAFYYGNPNSSGPFTFPSSNHTSAFLAIPYLAPINQAKELSLSELLSYYIGQSTSIDQKVIDSNHPIQIYTIDGRRVNRPQKGINIIRSAEGRVIKKIY